MNLEDHLRVQLKSNFFQHDKTLDEKPAPDLTLMSGQGAPRQDHSQLVQMPEEQDEESDDEYHFTDNQFKSRFPKLKQKAQKSKRADDHQHSTLDFIPTKHQ